MFLIKMRILEANIREALTKHLRTVYHQDSLVLHELGISEGRIIADVAVLHETLHGYEIKSHHDNFLRLPKQVKYYDWVFDTNTLVYAGWDDDVISSHIPEWWGMMKVEEINDELQVKVIRESKPNPKQKIMQLVKLLWKEEAINALIKHNLYKGFSGKRRGILWRRLAENIPHDEIKKIIYASCKSRPTWKK